MRMTRVAGVVAALAGLVVRSVGSSAATNTPPATKIVGPYKFVLQIGPAENMSMSGMGEISLGGKEASCKMPGQGHAAGPNICNHNLELHITTVKGGHIVGKARVSITMTNTRTYKVIQVPIQMMMMGSRGMKDYHYGNNVHANAGTYQIVATVNGKTTTFTMTVM